MPVYNYCITFFLTTPLFQSYQYSGLCQVPKAEPLGQADTLHTHTVLRAVSRPLKLTAIPRGFETEVFMHRVPFLLPSNSVKALRAKLNVTGLHLKSENV